LEKLLPLDLENFLKMTVSLHFLSDGLMDSNYICYTDVSWRDAGFYFHFFKGRERELHFHTSSTFSELLKRFQWILVEMKYMYKWSPTSVVVFQNNLHKLLMTGVLCTVCGTLDDF
jgi:hypothetical protein